MKVEIENIGKQFRNQWIFKDINLSLTSSQSLAILGTNGSGKSTLIQIISGSLPSTTGRIRISINDIVIKPYDIYKYVSIAAPYMELVEDFTLEELLKFHSTLKPFINNHTTSQVQDIIGLPNTKSKSIKYFSSGMKQRVRLALAILSDTPLLLLDEPTSNLDAKSIEWYKKLIVSHIQNRVVIVCSNYLKNEYDFCQQNVELN